MNEPLPLISCICPTFGRYPAWGHLLEEAVESFLRQDYPAECRELVILNDCTGQELLPPGPGTIEASRFQSVRICNQDKRYATLGEKYNAAIGLAAGELVLPWEDDDISLPHRISQAVSMLGGAGYWKPPQVWYYPRGGKPVWEHAIGVRHHASIFTRVAWEKVGGYPAVTGNQDAAMDSRLRGRCWVAPEGNLPPSEWAYVYRWGVSPCHLSGASDMAALWASQRGHPGRFAIMPHWREDYTALTRTVLADRNR